MLTTKSSESIDEIKKTKTGSTKIFRELIKQVEETIPLRNINTKDQKVFPITFRFERNSSSSLMGQCQGKNVYLYPRAFTSTGIFFYTSCHEIGHIIFFILNDETRAKFLSALGVSEKRWKSIVINAADSESSAIKKASILEVKRIHEEFAEAYAEYWTKRSFLKARSKSIFQFMRSLFYFAENVSSSRFKVSGLIRVEEA